MRPGPVADPTAIGSVSTPPYAVLPDPNQLFVRRASRLRTYAAVSPMRPYLELLAEVADVQAAIAEHRGPATPGSDGAGHRAAELGMPPLDRMSVADTLGMQETLQALFDGTSRLEMPIPARIALESLRGAPPEDLRGQVLSVLEAVAPVETLAEHVFVAAAVQVQLARLAAALDSSKLVSVGDGLCPACGGPPVASIIVDRPSAHGARYCVCSSCATQWHYVRIRCCACGTTKGIGYQEVDGTGGMIKAETCDGCGTYLKVMYENRDATIEPVADDVGTLPLDLLMRDGPYRRAAANPFLARF